MKCKKCGDNYMIYSRSTVCCGHYLMTGKPKKKAAKKKVSK